MYKYIIIKENLKEAYGKTISNCKNHLLGPMINDVFLDFSNLLSQMMIKWYSKKKNPVVDKSPFLCFILTLEGTPAWQGCRGAPLTPRPGRRWAAHRTLRPRDLPGLWGPAVLPGQGGRRWTRKQRQTAGKWTWGSDRMLSQIWPCPVPLPVTQKTRRYQWCSTVNLESWVLASCVTLRKF